MPLSCSLHCPGKAGQPETEGAKAEVGCDLGRCEGETEALPPTEHESVPCLVPGLVHAHFTYTVD